MKIFKNLIAPCLLSLALTWTASAQTDITTWQVNLQHTGNNANETILTPGNISSQGNFGLLFSQATDGQSFGQPLMKSGVNVSGTTHNIVYVATEHCSIYAFDADSNTGANANPIWHVSLLPAGTIPLPQGVTGSNDILIEVGLTTTPVIDPATNTIYIVSKVQRTSDTTYHQYLYALDLATGATKFNSPVEINTTFPGSAIDSSGGVIAFNPLREHMRAAMSLYNGVVYLAYASHSDTSTYHGEIIGYDKTTLQVVKTFIATPNSGNSNGGIWQSGASPAFDTAGNMFVSIANGSWDQNDPQYGTNWGQSMLKIDTTGTNVGMNVAFSNTLNWFTPNNWAVLNNGDANHQGDLDLGSGGLLILPDQAGPYTHLLVGGGKGSVIYVIDRDSMGGINTPDNAVQEIPDVNGAQLFVTPAYFNGFIYHSAVGNPLEQRAVGYNPVDGSYIAATPILSPEIYNGKGSGCFITSNGTSNGIVWMLTGAGINAYNATNVSSGAIYSANSALPGNIGTQNNKFCLPMVANGKLYYTAYETNTNIGHLLVYGLQPTPPGAPATPANVVAASTSSSDITVTWAAGDSGTQYIVKRSTSPNGGFAQTGQTTNAGVTSFEDINLTANTTYYYQIVATNSLGDSNASSIATATTFPNYTENGLVAYLPMDETGGTTLNDVTGNGHTGTINGEAQITAGLINNGVGFHGTGQSPSNAIVANKSDMQFAANQSFTLSGWVNASALRSSEETIIAKSRDQGNYYGIWINASNQWVFRGPGGDVVGPAVTQGAWTHVAAVQDGVAGTRSLYINGALVASGTAQAADGAGDFWMGQQNILNVFESFPGTIDEVRLYNRALASTEITKLMGTPVLAAMSNQVDGTSGTFGFIIWPAPSKKVEPRKGSTPGSYSLVLNFSAPVSGISASLGLQSGGSATGSVSSINYDSTGMVVTVALTGVGNLQALNLHLSGIPAGTATTAGTADIPFNVLWGDVNGDGVVNALDLSIVQNNHAAIVSSTTFDYDINCNGTIDATDDSLVSSAIGTSLWAQTDTNLAVYQPATALSSNGANTPNMAFDQNLTTRWESAQGIDPEWIYVDLGSVCTIHSVLLNWENAAGANYTIDVCTGDPTVAGNWSTIQTVTGNTAAGVLNYPGLNASARYVRMNGTARVTQYGYSLYDFEVIGLSGTSSGSAPAITGGLTANGVVGTAFNYQITASNNPTSYAASGLPGGLGINTATGDITGMPTATGTTSVPISATNANGTGNATLTIAVTVTPPAPVISSGTTASGIVGSAFNYQIAASNNPTSYGAAGLPTGLSVSTSTGAITGTPTATGTTSATISATNAGGTGSATVTITVNPTPPAPVITSGTTTAGTQGSAFSYQIAASNNPTSYGATGLPGGLGVNTSTGAITGTPTASGTTSATISATNAGGTGSATVVFSIAATGGGGSAPVITSGTTTTGIAGVAFSYQITASNTPTSYNATGLPAGLSVNTSTGAITGTPTATGTSTATISAINTSGTGTATLVISVTGDTNLALNMPATASSVNPGSGNVAANAFDGNTGTRWESVQGATADPSYIYVDLGQVDTIHTVVINWENAAAANYTIDISNDATNWTTIQTVTGNTGGGILTYPGFNVSARYVRMNGTTRTTIYGYSILEFQVFGVTGTGGGGAAPVITSGTTVSGTAGSAVSYQIAASNTPTSYGASGLPAGLSVNTSTGLVSGTATASGTTSATVSAINTSGTGSAAVVFSISGTGTGDTNLALNMPATASSVNPGSGNVAANAFDGNTGTRWESVQGAAADPSYIYVDLGQVDTIHTVVINWENAAAANYTIDISNDATNWTTIQTVTGNTGGGILTYPGFNVTARYVRMNGTTRTTIYGYSILEFQVLGVAGAGGGSAPVITSGTTASGNIGTAFSYQIAATSSPASYSASGLPGGLGVNTSTGAITGTPTATGTSTATINAINSSGTGSSPLVISIASSAAPVITSGTTVSGTAGSAFSYQIAATNTPTGYSASGLPAGLSVNNSTGAITGIPTASGTTSATISATNTAGTGSASLVISVAASGDTNLALNMTATASSVNPGSGNVAANAFDGNVGTRWESVQGATADPSYIYVDLGQVDTIHSVVINWENAAGANYTIDISNDATNWTTIQTVTGNTTGGVHTYSGFNVTARYVRMNGTARTTQYGYSILEFQVLGVAGIGGGSAPVITSGTTVSGNVGTALSYQIAATNSPTSYSASGLPGGLGVNTSTGAITGTPTATGTSTATINAINSSGTGSSPLVISIASSAAPVITSGTTVSGTAGSAFSYQIAATNTPTSYSAVGLPAGLSVDTNAGTITGTPTASGTNSATISATNAAGTGSAPLVISVAASGDTNLALNMTATASSVNPGSGNVAANAVDGNTGTRWESVQGVTADPSYIYVDLGQVHTIHSVVINWENAAGADYTIDICSGDPTVAGNWTTIQTVTGNTTGGVHTYSGFNVTARYVRMNGTTRTTQYGYSIYEFQVLGQ